MNIPSSQVREIFLDALAASDRETYLIAACGPDERLRARVQDLLASHESAGRFLNDPPQGLAETRPNDEPEEPGTKIGRYKLLQEIGEGGFGIVYMAEQQEPVRRKVALKIIKLGMDTREVIARFEAERQALAMMDHPNIARVLDAGTTATTEGGYPGRPYFVMELVRGVPITRFCDGLPFRLVAPAAAGCQPAGSNADNGQPPDEAGSQAGSMRPRAEVGRDAKPTGLTIRERLALFLDVCHAVQHAHQKGVIHRDLKPSNILVTLHDGKPVPKVIDFGVAKAISRQLTEKTLFTAYGQMIGTPAYMSPEQAEMSGLDVDTRSDVYSLGVLLYELITGGTPLEGKRLRQAGYAEMQRIICQEEPPTPSTRLATLGDALAAIAHHRGSDPKRIAQFVRGDLDWIVMKCLEKDRNRRYETVDALAQDIERHLNDEPIHARPPSRIYRLRKFTRKHRTGIAAVSAVILALTGGVVIASVSLAQAIAERDKAIRNLHRGCELVDNVIAPAAEIVHFAPGVRELHANLVNEGLKFYSGIFNEAKHDPVVRHGMAKSLLLAAGQQQHSGGDVAAPARDAIAILRGLIAEYPENFQYKQQFADAHGLIASFYWRDEMFSQAFEATEDVTHILHEMSLHDRSKSKVFEELVAFELDKAHFTARIGNLASAEQLFQKGLSKDPAPEVEYIARQRLADLLMKMGRYDEAATELDQARRIAQRMIDQGETTSQVAGAQFWLCTINETLALHSMSTGNLELAHERIAEALGDLQVQNADLPHVYWARQTLSVCHSRRAEVSLLAGREDEALEAARQVIAYASRDVLQDRYYAAIGHWLLAELLHQQGKTSEAESHFQQAANGLNEMVTALPDEPFTGERIICFLSNCGSDKYRDPHRAVRIAEHMLTTTNGPLWLYLGLARYRAGDWQGADEAINKSIQLRSGGDAMDWLLLAACQHKAGRHEKAQESFAHAQDLIAARAPIYYGWIGTLGYHRIRAEVESLMQTDSSTSPLPLDGGGVGGGGGEQAQSPGSK